jgi:type II secretory pathway predicted ATPase ExeA
MYEKHFGLKSRPFRPGPDASGIFVGPAQVKVMASLKKALAPADAVVSVTGAVGVGKTTVVNRALESLIGKRAVARVGRMQLAADEVLELLLTEFAVSRQPNGTIQRFAAFKRLLHDWAAGGTRAFIIVEDAERIGNDALIELEALTASESADSAGACIVLMGQPSLAEQLSQPALARLRQRIRLRQAISPFTAPEVQGYIKHCIRAVGGEADAIFDPGAVDMLYRCSEGVPRVVNNLCESVMAAAAEAGAILIMPQLVQHIANEEFGLQPTLPPGRIRLLRKADRDAGSPTPLTATPHRATLDSKPSPAPATAEPVVKVDAAAPEPVVTEFEPIPVIPFTPEPEVRRPPLANRATAPAAAGELPKTLPASEPPKAPAAIELPKTPTVTQVPKVAAATVQPKAPATPVVPKAPAVTQVSNTAAVAEAPKAPAVKVVPELPAAMIVEAKSGEPPFEEIPELIQDTQPQLTALPADTDLPDLTDLVFPAKSNGAAAVMPKTKPAAEYTLPTLDDIPTLSGDMRIDTRAKSSTPKPAQPEVRPAGAGSPKVAQTTPVKAEAVQSKPATIKKADDPPSAPEVDVSKGDTTITEIPAWDRDPTLAELKPDIAALEAALAAVPEPPASTAGNGSVKPAPVPPAAKPKVREPAHNFNLPEITLEKELQVKEIEAQELLRKSSPPDTREVDADLAVKRKHGFDLDRLAAELGKARSLEDVDDKLAETLFGEEMAAAAAEVAAMVAADAAANKPAHNDNAKVPNRAEATAKTTEPAASVPATASRAAAAISPPANSHRPATAKIGTPPASLKPATVAGPAIEITLAVDPEPLPAPPVAIPEPIEEQFGTSMTATLKALSAAQVAKMDEPDKDDKEKAPRRLFGLFRSPT